ncbi:cytochrome P450 monooxygenase aclL [Colletotrichum spaethianum]|uniref:Cytochrome P450 monooxygenase aclL n=1 Tax=Colletotrichum spaethianum TaxID=700344 RepID=A0AA37LC18_9PEZI|nr:cytochrome P450 monooxygenase aclL [Colletotrichum spaethianum]GKT45881.1 cytochrome P450 monooxygenase aclL [Colletotrichum spaethianum]
MTGNAQFLFPTLPHLTVGVVLQSIVALGHLYILGRCLYNIYFHPLSTYPGPKLWATSRIPWTYHSIGGHLPDEVYQLHKQYGPIVRIAPDELSYTSGTAWKAIYGARNPEFSKCLDGRGVAGPTSQLKGPNINMVVSEPVRHGRLRRAIAPAFSERALRGQEEFIQHHSDKLIGQLRRAVRNKPDEPQNLTRWYSLAAFDIISDLAFGKPAGCLDSFDQPWIQVLGNRTRSLVWMQLAMHYQVEWLLDAFSPKGTMEARRKHRLLTERKVEERIANPNGKDRRDFMSYIIENESERLTNEELNQMASSFIVAGSGTSATAMSGISYFIGRDRTRYNRLVQEIRTAFATEKEITLESTARLPYLRAVIEETLRLYPPSPSTFPRWVPFREGVELDGCWVPHGTAVGVHPYSAHRMEDNFRDALEFVPERWLDQTGGTKYASDDKAAMKPFSFGTRDCVGKNLAYAEIRIIMTKLLWNVDFELVNPSEAWIEKQSTFLMWEKGPLYVKLRPRIM